MLFLYLDLAIPFSVLVLYAGLVIISLTSIHISVSLSPLFFSHKTVQRLPSLVFFTI